MAPGSQDPLAAVLQPGDTFTWTIGALGNNQWTVLNGGDVFPMMAMAVEESADRTSDFQFDLLNDGLVVFTKSELASVQSLVHMGTNTISLPYFVKAHQADGALIAGPCSVLVTEAGRHRLPELCAAFAAPSRVLQLT